MREWGRGRVCVLGLTRFRGHLTIWEKGVHDAKEETALCG